MQPQFVEAVGGLANLLCWTCAGFGRDLAPRGRQQRDRAMLSARVLSLFRAHGWDLAAEPARLPEPGSGGAVTVPLDGPLCARIGLKRRQVDLFDPEGLPASTLDHFACDLLLPRLLAYDGQLVLHAGLVAGPSGALGFLGPSGAGKSTLAAAFYRHGLVLLGDDVATLAPAGDGFIAAPLYAGLRLFPDAIETVLREAPPAERVAHYTDKRRLEVGRPVAPAPVAALFLLGPADGAREVSLRRLPPVEACMMLLANSFALRPGDRDEAQRRFRLASDAAAGLVVCALDYPRDFAALDAVVSCVLETFGAGPAS